MGDLTALVRKGYFVLPEEYLTHHIVCLGSSGSGKSETLRRLAYLGHKVYRQQVILLNAKGDRHIDPEQDTPSLFVAAMRAAGAQRICVFPEMRYNGWQGDATALFNRLISVIDFSESPYYGDVAADVLRLALGSPTGVPRSSDELLANMYRRRLIELYKGTRQMAAVADLDKDKMAEVRRRYRVFFAAMNGLIDGTLDYADADAIYFGIDGLSLQYEAPRLGRFLALDLAHYASRRKRRGLQTLMIIDEFNALRMRNETALLFDMARSSGTSLVISSQSYAGLGPQEYADRLVGAANTYIVHNCSDPYHIIKRAGKKRVVVPGWSEHQASSGGQRHLNLQSEWKVPIERVQQLGTGEAVVIHRGLWQQQRTARVPLAPGAAAQAMAFIQQLEQIGGGQRTAEEPPTRPNNEPPGPSSSQPSPEPGSATSPRQANDFSGTPPPDPALPDDDEPDRL